MASLTAVLEWVVFATVRLHSIGSSEVRRNRTNSPFGMIQFIGGNRRDMASFIRWLAIALATGSLSAGQAFAPRGDLKFEVASVRSSQPGTQSGGVRPAPGGRRYLGVGVPLRAYLWVAYQVKPEQIAGGPGWVDADPYDLNAEAEQPSSLEDLHIMLQNVLTERFKLRFHFERKERLAYLLILDKGGPKNLKTRPGATGGDTHLDEREDGLLHQKWNAHCATMNFLTWALSALFDQPVINQTDHSGCFDFELVFTRELPAGTPEGQLFNSVPIDSSGPSIFQALQNQLGLKLEARRAPVEIMVIDHAERPTEN
jgi:uncharacterized protein (TIGR03435 family)